MQEPAPEECVNFFLSGQSQLACCATDGRQSDSKLPMQGGQSCSAQMSGSGHQRSLHSSHDLPSLMARHGGSLPQSLDAEPPPLLHGLKLVEAVFRRLFPDDFQQVVPVRNHKVRQG